MNNELYRVPKENWQTRLNYSLIAKGIFAGVAFETASYVLPGTNLRQIIDPDISRDILKGAAYSGYLGHASWGMVSLNFKSWEKLAIFSGITAPIREFSEQLGNNMTNPNDVGSFQKLQSAGLGGVLWFGFDMLAKGLHDSGVTYPIYKGLGIKHRVIDVEY